MIIIIINLLASPKFRLSRITFHDQIVFQTTNSAVWLYLFNIGIKHDFPCINIC